MARHHHHHRLWVLLAAVSILFTACGGDSSDSDDSGDAGSGTASSDSGSSDDSADTDSGSDSDDGSADDTPADVVEQAEDALDAILGDSEGVATITIGDQTWELAVYPENVIASCDADFFGGFFANLASEGELTDPLDAMTITLPGGDFTDPPAVTLRVNVGEEAEWIADETYYERAADLPPGIGVTDFSIDGNTARGTATFFEEESFFQWNAGLGDLVVEDGTFEVTCAG